MFATYVGVAYLYWSQAALPPDAPKVLGIGIGAAILAFAGLLDDLDRLQSFKSKLALQIAGCCVLFPFGLVLQSMPVPFLGDVALGWMGYPITMLWVLGLTNIFNFMDGLDGIAAGTAVVVSAVMVTLFTAADTSSSHMIFLVLLVSSLGFLFFNFPRAQIFLGDVGSQFLGFSLAATAVLAATAEPGGVSILVVPLLFFHFIFDTFFTFCRRLIAHENVTQAHKSHLYQLLNQAGQSHARVSTLHFLTAMVQGGGAYLMVQLPASQQWAVFLPFLLFEIAYAIFVMKLARRRVALDRAGAKPL